MSSWKPELSDFDLANAEPLGCGAISQVLKAQHKPSGKYFAIKVISKMQVTQQKKVEDVMREKQALYALSPHPFITTIFATLQSADELYFVMEWLPHGDLREYVTRHGPMGFRAARCLLAQVIMGLEAVFRKGMVIRDLKAENIGFSSDYRVKIFDFDTCAMPPPSSSTDGNKAAAAGHNLLPVSNKGVAIPREGQSPQQQQQQQQQQEIEASGEIIHHKKEKRRMTVSEIKGISQQAAAFCGTAQYVSPEMLGTTSWSYSSDLWGLGVLAYFVLTGLHIFEGVGSFQVMQQIVAGAQADRVKDIICGKFGHPAAAADFVLDLLKTDPTLRLGVNNVTRKFDASQLRSHALFDGLEMESSFWSRLDFCVQKEESSANPRDNKMMDPLRPNQEDPQRSFREYYYVNPKPVIVVPPTTATSSAGVSLPSHSTEYAKYVFDAPASAFDEWVLGGGGGCGKKDELVDKDNASSATSAAAAAAASGANEDSCEGGSRDVDDGRDIEEEPEHFRRTNSTVSSEGSVEIIDDQGIVGSGDTDGDLPMFIQKMKTQNGADEFQGEAGDGAISGAMKPTAFTFPMDKKDEEEEQEK